MKRHLFCFAVIKPRTLKIIKSVDSKGIWSLDFFLASWAGLPSELKKRFLSLDFFYCIVETWIRKLKALIYTNLVDK